MNITVRLDDITPDMDWERFYKFKALLDQYQVKPLIGVVPDNRDELLKGSGSPMDPEPFFEYIWRSKERKLQWEDRFLKTMVFIRIFLWHRDIPTIGIP